MRSRERVLTAWDHEEPDRVPRDYYANPGIDQRLKIRLGIASGDDEGLRKALGVDFRPLHIPYVGKPLHVASEEDVSRGIRVSPEWGFKVRKAEHEHGIYWDFCDFPLKGMDEELASSWPLPSADQYDYSLITSMIEQWDEFALYVGHSGVGDIMNSLGQLCGTERVYMAMALDDPAFMILAERKARLDLEIHSRILETAKGRADFLWIGEDLGTQNSPIIGMDSYTRILKPIHRQFCQLAESYGIPVMIHSCGSAHSFYPQFTEIGITAVDAVQPEAAGMGPESLKARFGDQLLFHGAISVARMLTFETEQTVYDTVRETLEVMSPGGGYALSPAHLIQDNTPVENVLALYRAAEDHGWYAKGRARGGSEGRVL